MAVKAQNLHRLCQVISSRVWPLFLALATSPVLINASSSSNCGHVSTTGGVS
jgi:hypothetical protein